MISITKIIAERDLSRTLGLQNYRRVNPPNVSLAKAPIGLNKTPVPGRTKKPSLASAQMGVNKG